MHLQNIISKKIDKTLEQYELTFSKESDKEGSGFMIFALENIFKSFDTTEILNGIIDSNFRKQSYDYCIDAIYITGNDDNIESKVDIENYNEDTKFCFHLFQFKRNTNSELSSFKSFKDGINDTFITNSFDKEQNIYLNQKIELTNDLKDVLFDKFSSSQISVKLYYVFTGVKENIETNNLLSNEIQKTIQLLKTSGFNNSTYEIIDAQQLLDLERSKEDIVEVIAYKEKMKYIPNTVNENTKVIGYICLVEGKEIAELVKKHQTKLFEANIRDYLKNDLNSKILQTSSDESEAKFFWSYNNGLTITCSKVEELPLSRYRLHGMQIVNGCQTSNALYFAYRNIEKLHNLEQKSKIKDLTSKEKDEMEKIRSKQLQPDTSLIVRIIETNDTELIYKITEKTNSQTPIKSFSLKANDKIHELIEDVLKDLDIYYERRINYYKNQKITKGVISIKQLFQIYMAVYEFQPCKARATTSTLFDTYYDKVFPEKYSKVDCHSYAIVSLLNFRIKHAIKSYEPNKINKDYEVELLLYMRILG